MNFKSDAGHLDFEMDKKIPEQTPTLSLSGQGELTDQAENVHQFRILLSGTLESPQMTLSSDESWSPAAVLMAILTGTTPDDLSRKISADPSLRRVGGSSPENLMKSLTAQTLNQVFGNAAQRFGLDRFTVSVGAGSADFKACKRAGRFVNVCGVGEVGYAGSSRVEGSVVVKLTDVLSLQAKGEYTNQYLDTFQGTRGKLELKFQIPIGP